MNPIGFHVSVLMPILDLAVFASFPLAFDVDVGVCVDVAVGSPRLCVVADVVVGAWIPLSI